MRVGWRVLPLMLAVWTGCGRGGEAPIGEEAGDTLATAEQAERTAELLSPVRAAAIAQAGFGDLAMQRADDDDVRRYGQVVGTDHRALVALLDSAAQEDGASLEETVAARDLANSMRMAHAGLDNLTGDAFDVAFVRAQVESHRQLLDRIDHDLLPAASGARAEPVLRDVRTLVDAHLARGRQLLAAQLGEPEPVVAPAPAPAGPPTPPTTTGGDGAEAG